MTRFRMLSRCGEGLALLKRIQDEGWDCDFWTPPNVTPELYDGLIGRADDWREGLDDETIVLFDAPGSGALAAEVPGTWGASPFNDVLQFDRQFGLKIAKAHGLRIPHWGRFNAIAPAVEYLEGCKGGSWDVELPNGQVFYENRTSEQMKELLELTEPLTDFYLMERIPGENLTLSGWYVNGELVPNSLFSAVEKHRFLAGDYGPRCSSPQLCLGWFWPPKKKRDGETTPTLYRHTLKKLEPFLKQHNYQGPLCLRLRIAESDGIPTLYAFETGFRYPAGHAMLEVLQIEIGEVLATMAHGEVPELSPSYDWTGAVAVSIPPYPYFAGRGNYLIQGDLEQNHVWPLDVKLVAGSYFTAGAHGVVVHITASAKDQQDLSAKLRERADNIIITDGQLRCDGPGGEQAVDLLRKWHYF